MSETGASEVPIPALVLTEAEAAKALRLSVRTMQRMRLDGDGPVFVMMRGRRVGYRIGALTDWVRAREATSTSAVTVALAKTAA